jgi:hypothetical protein
LKFDRTGDGIYGAGELHEDAVSHDLDNSAVMFRHYGLKDFHAARLEGGQSACLVSLHHSAVANYISRENGGETALRRLFRHAERPPMLLCSIF